MKTAVLTFLAALLLPTEVDDPKPVSFAILASFEYTEGTKLPGKVTKYDEKKVKVSGFMATEDGTEGDVEYFVLINDGCGCEGTPKLNELIFCAMPEGEKVTIKPGVVDVIGTLYVGETKEEGVVVSLYTLAVESVK